jgi:hypothetical protein
VKPSPSMGPSNSHGASIRSWRSAARKVVVFQCPCGALVWSRRPRGAYPGNGIMLVTQTNAICASVNFDAAGAGQYGRRYIRSYQDNRS